MLVSMLTQLLDLFSGIYTFLVDGKDFSRICNGQMVGLHPGSCFCQTPFQPQHCLP